MPLKSNAKPCPTPFTLRFPTIKCQVTSSRSVAQALSVGRPVLVQDPDSGMVEWAVVVDESSRRCTGPGPDGKPRDRGPGRAVLRLHAPGPATAPAKPPKEPAPKPAAPKPKPKPPSGPALGGMQVLKKKKASD